MPCLIALLALLVPRVVMVFIWLMTDWFSRAFQTVLWPLLGFIFMPYTTLAYMGAMLNAGGVTGIWLVIVIAAAVVDIGHWGGSGRYGVRRRRRVA